MAKSTVILDGTMLTSLMTCARKYDFSFNEQLQSAEGKSNAMEAGSIAHAILEFYNKAVINGSGRNEALSQGFAAGREYLLPYNEMNKYILDKDHKGVENTPEESEKKGNYQIIGSNYVVKTMEQYFDYYSGDTFTIIGAEETRGAVIYENEEFRVLYKAKYDTIIDTNSGIGSLDHKTMKQNRPSIRLNNQFIGQCVLLRCRNVIVNKIGFQTSLAPQDKFKRETISYSADQLVEWQQEIVPYYASMLLSYTEAGNFPPNYTNCETKYGFCTYKEICESDRGMRDEVKKINFIVGKKWDV